MHGMVKPQQSIPTEDELQRLSIGQIVGYAVEVTPEIAKVWLSANSENRAIRKSHVTSLARDISEDRWKFTHQGVAFSETGRLIDGQHRLTAIIKANKPAMLTVFLGISDNMFGALDRGATRSIRDEIGKTSTWVDPAGFLAKMVLPGDARKLTPSDVQAVMAAFRNELHDVVTTFSGYAPGRSSAGIKGALIVRLSISEPSHRKYLLNQWKAFAKLDLENMDRSTASMLKRLDRARGGIDGGSVGPLERAAIAWVAWGPDRTLQRIILHDPGKSLAEIRDIVRKRLSNDNN